MTTLTGPLMIEELSTAPSVQLSVVIERSAELIRLGEELAARNIAPCGSVARGEDTDSSDIDFYVRDFDRPGADDARQRADRPVQAFPDLLQLIKVDA